MWKQLILVATVIPKQVCLHNRDDIKGNILITCGLLTFEMLTSLASGIVNNGTDIMEVELYTEEYDIIINSNFITVFTPKYFLHTFGCQMAPRS